MEKVQLRKVDSRKTTTEETTLDKALEECVRMEKSTSKASKEDFRRAFEHYGWLYAEDGYGRSVHVTKILEVPQ